jgi:hypothetical protein
MLSRHYGRLMLQPSDIGELIELYPYLQSSLELTTESAEASRISEEPILNQELLQDSNVLLFKLDQMLRSSASSDQSKPTSPQPKRVILGEHRCSHVIPPISLFPPTFIFTLAPLTILQFTIIQSQVCSRRHTICPSWRPATSLRFSTPPNRTLKC